MLFDLHAHEYLEVAGIQARVGIHLCCAAHEFVDVALQSLELSVDIIQFSLQRGKLVFSLLLNFLLYHEMVWLIWTNYLFCCCRFVAHNHFIFVCKLQLLFVGKA